MKHKLLRSLEGGNGVLVAFGSFLYGLQIFRFPHILSSYQVYTIVDDFTDNRFLGILFLSAALVKIFGSLLRKPLLGKIGLVSLSFLWGVFFFSFLISPPPNTVWTLALTMCLILFRASLWGDS